MRKITLMLTLLAFSLLTFAQMPHIEKVKSNADFHVNNYKSVKSVKAAGDVYWAEDFDSTRWAASVNEENLAIPDNMPDGWTVYDGTGSKYYWHWSNKGPRLYYYYKDIPIIERFVAARYLKSTTSDNGVMMLESGYFNTDVNGDALIPDSRTTMDAFVQTPAIDLSGKPGAILRFQQIMSFCCASDYLLTVSVSADYDPTDSDVENGHWSEYDATNGLGTNEDAPNPTYIEIDISDVAADQESVYIRWHQKNSSFYYWEIDDIEIVEPMANNLMIENTWADYLYVPDYTVEDYDGTYDWYGGYVDIPLDLVGDFVQFRAAVKNFGLATQTGVQLNTVITKDDETEVYNKLSDKVDIEKARRDTLTTVGFTPTSKGHYQVSYTVTQDQEDEYMANNYDAIFFNITDTVYSRTTHNPENYITVSPQDWVGAADGDYLLQYYQVPGESNVTVSSATIYFSSSNDSASIAEGQVSTIFRLYGVEDDDISETPIVSSDLYTLKLEDMGTFITLPFVKDGTEIIEPGEYWVAVEAYTNYTEDNKVRFKIGNDKSVPYTKRSTYVHTGGTTYLTMDNAVIDLNIVPTTPQDVTFNVNMSRQITKENFDPATDKINISGTMNSDGFTEMTDADGDSIYTYVLEQQIIGSTIEYMFAIGEVVETLDANRTHTVSANGAQNILTAWYSDDDGVGIEDLNNLNEISIYPNPVSDNLHIDNINNINRIVISNVLGQEVRTINNPVNNVTINASDFNKGMYIVTIIDNNNNSKSTRFIKK